MRHCGFQSWPYACWAQRLCCRLSPTAGLRLFLVPDRRHPSPCQPLCRGACRSWPAAGTAPSRPALILQRRQKPPLLLGRCRPARRAFFGRPLRRLRRIIRHKALLYCRFKHRRESAPHIADGRRRERSAAAIAFLWQCIGEFGDFHRRKVFQLHFSKYRQNMQAQVSAVEVDGRRLSLSVLPCIML